MNNVDKQYFDMLRYVLKNGTRKSDRTGTGTISVFDYTLKFNLKDGFPLITSKKLHFKSVVIELLWFLKGSTNIKWLIENGCNIWNGDCFKNYCTKNNINFDKVLPENKKEAFKMKMDEFIYNIKNSDEFSKEWGELGHIYGYQWRNWGGDTKAYDDGYNDKIDQITNLITDLKNNPDSRRLMVNAWNVGDIYDKYSNIVLPPCHYGFQCYTRELSIEERKNIWDKKVKGLHIMLYTYDNTEESWHKKYDEQNIPKRYLSLKVNIRSNDVFLGCPFNIASYGLLLTMLAKEVNMIPDQLILSIGDAHIYSNHIEQCKQQLKQKTFKLPNIEIDDKSIFDIEYSDITLNNYESSASIKAELSN